MYVPLVKPSAFRIALTNGASILIDFPEPSEWDDGWEDMGRLSPPRLRSMINKLFVVEAADVKDIFCSFSGAYVSI